jgi:hypothetical protein
MQQNHLTKAGKTRLLTYKGGGKMFNMKITSTKDNLKTVDNFFFFCLDTGEKHDFCSFNKALEKVGFEKIDLEKFNSLVEAGEKRDWYYRPHFISPNEDE